MLFVKSRVNTWTNDLKVLVDSPDFDFLELKPLFAESKEFVHYVSRSKFYLENINSIVPLFIHMICAICCLGSSAVYHLFKDHSELAHKTLVRADYAGISIMIAGSNTPPIFYSFFCQEMHGKVYH